MTASLLLVDLGNTRLKWRVQVGEQVVDAGTGWEALPALAVEAETVLVASVAAPERDRALREVLGARGSAAWFAQSRARCDDLVNSYAEPGRMGVDRWLAMLGARALTSQRLCVVDAGSALTIDFVAADGRHEGGFILPGSRLMAGALLAETEKVRFDVAPAVSLAPGRSTAEAVVHGIALAQVAAVDLALRRAGEPRPRLFLCGGDAALLAAEVTGPMERHDDLVFGGLLLQAREEGVIT
jgi:type III pantothenate kinase